MNDNRTSRAGATATAQVQCETSPPHRILVVEDDGCIRRFNAEMLIRSDYQVDAAENGAVAWDMLQLKSYDLLITDIDMPKVSGVDLLKKLHAVRLAMPVIMATGTLPEEEFNRNPWLQPAAMLLKPFTGDELLGTVETVLRGPTAPASNSSGANLTKPVLRQCFKEVRAGSASRHDLGIQDSSLFVPNLES